MRRRISTHPGLWPKEPLCAKFLTNEMYTLNIVLKPSGYRDEGELIIYKSNKSKTHCNIINNHKQVKNTLQYYKCIPCYITETEAGLDIYRKRFCHYYDKQHICDCSRNNQAAILTMRWAIF